ncbi:MAG: hypothetical protein K0S74_1746 [Chlamydiales bacterium]|jgi:hypothetical protein|nr:hypothetical protein [Chlamydiales bacterium]
MHIITNIYEKCGKFLLCSKYNVLEIKPLEIEGKILNRVGIYILYHNLLSLLTL